MRRCLRAGALACVAALLTHTAFAGEDAVPLTADVVKSRWHSRLKGMHFSARVRLSMEMGGIHEERELLVWRTDEAVGAERVMVRFTQP